MNSQIQPATALKITKRPMNTMIWLSTGAFSTGFTITRSMMTPARKDRPTASRKASQTGAPRPTSVQAI